MAIHKVQTLEDTVYFGFGANDTNGSGDDGAAAVWDVRLNGAAAGAAPVLSGNATLLTHVNYPDGAYEVAIAATAANGFAVDTEYNVYATLTVDGETPTGFIGSFRLVSSGAVLDSVPQIISDSTAFLGASVAAILADVTGINGDAMRGTNNAALAATALSTAVWTAAMAAHLDADISSRSSHNANAVRDAILDDATRFSGASIATILGHVNGLGGAAMRGTNNAALAAVCTVARLSELDPANIPADVDTLLARLTAVRAGYLDELAAANIPADVDTLLGRLTAARAAFLDVAISSRAAPGDAMDLVADALDAAALAASATAEIDAVLVAAHGPGAWTTGAGGDATAANQALIQAAIAALNDPTAAAIDAVLTAAHGAGAWTTGVGGDATLANQLAILATGGAGPWTSGGAGGGANTVTITMQDVGTAPILGLGVTVWNATETAVIGNLVTDASGECEFHLDNGNFRVLTPDTPAWVGSGNNLVVAGATAQTYTITARTIPVPSVAGKYVLYINASDEQQVLVGAAAWSLKIIEVSPVGLDSDDLVTLTEEDPFVTNASGQVSWEVSKEVTHLKIQITRTMADATTKTTEYSFAVDGTKADVLDRIDVADLLTE